MRLLSFCLPWLLWELLCLFYLEVSHVDRLLTSGERAAHQAETHGDMLGGDGGGVRETLGKINVPSGGELMSQVRVSRSRPKLKRGWMMV